MKDFIHMLIAQIANHPEAINVSVVEGKESYLIEIGCHPDDIKHLIGKNGSTVGAIRTILQVICRRTNKRFTLTILEPQECDYSQFFQR